MTALCDLGLNLVAHLGEASLRSLGLAVAVLVVIWAVRLRSSSQRHAAWTVVLGGMLTLPVLALVLPPMPLGIALWQPRTPLTAVDSSPPPFAPIAIPRPTTTPVFATDVPEASSPPYWHLLISAAYLVVALGLFARFILGYHFSRRVLQSAESVGEGRIAHVLNELATAPFFTARVPEVHESTSVLIPLTLGCRRPAIILPGNWRSWDDWKLRTVLGHELAHIQRRDWLVMVLASLNRCLFWFHPLAWWLERHLATLAEESTDEAVVCSIGDAHRYASVILEFAATLRPGGGRLLLRDMPAVGSHDVSRRIARILEAGRPSSGILTKRAWAAILAFGLPLVCGTAALQPTAGTAARSQPDIKLPSYSGLMNEGQRLSPAAAQELEQYLAGDPDDLVARAKLIAYYFAKGDTQPRLNHIFWVIEHHPESELLALSYQVWISPRTGLLNSQADYERARELWLGQAATHAQNASVLANAAEFVGQTDPFTAEEMLKRARRLEPANPKWIKRFARLYARAISSTASPSDIGGRPRMDPSFVRHVKNELDTSNDVVLVEMVRISDKEFETVWRDAARTSPEYAQFLLKRTESVGPANPQ